MIVLLAFLASQDGGFSLDDGFRYRSADGNFDLRVGGRLEEHYRTIFGRSVGPRTSPDTFFLREGLATLDGTLYRDVAFALHGDFASPVGLEEAYLEWRRLREFTLRFGQFRTPLGQETMTPTARTDCIERPTLSRFVPEVELGVEAAGELADGLLSWQLAVINGRAQPSSPPRATADDGDRKDAILRVTSMPLFGEPELLLRKLRIGVYGSIGGANGVPMAGEFDVATPGLNVLFLDSTAGLLDGRRERIGAELSLPIGPASIRGELLLRRDEVSDAAGIVDRHLTTRAWYGQVSCILYGAEKIPERGLIPARPFDLDAGDWGAIEAVIRVAGARIGAAEWVAVGNSLTGQSNSVLEYTLGLNWVPVRGVRLSINGVLEDYKTRLDFGRSTLWGLLLRFQVEF